MGRNRALLCALDIASMPTLAAQARRQPLPDGVLDVIRIAAGCEETLEEAVRQSGKEPRFVKAAAEFYVQQILLFSTVDSYRILGVQPGATREEMRTNMRWLMTWLHPDRTQAGWLSVFASRVLDAWREVGSGSAAVDYSATAQQRTRSRHQPHRVPWVAHPIEFRRYNFSKPLRGLSAAIFVLSLTAPSASVEAGARESVRTALLIAMLLPDALGIPVPDFSGLTPDPAAVR